MESSWQVAGRRKKNARGPALPAEGHSHGGPTACCPGHADLSEAEITSIAERTVSRVRDHIASLRGSQFAKVVQETVREAWQGACGACESGDVRDTETTGHMLCLGIGSVEASVASAFQLALACFVAEELGISNLAWADPQMRSTDTVAGTMLGFSFRDSATAPDTAARDGPLLLFMPHCDRALYERVLAANMAGDGLGGRLPHLARVVILGNSFEVYTARDELAYPGAPGTAASLGTASLIQRLRTCTSERPLCDFEQHPEAFNDLAVITFPAGALASCLEGTSGQQCEGGSAEVLDPSPSRRRGR